MSVRSAQLQPAITRIPTQDQGNIHTKPKVKSHAPLPPLPQSEARVVTEQNLLDQLSASLPQLETIAPAHYRNRLGQTRNRLARAAKASENEELAQALGEAVHFLDGERRLLEAMQIYRNLLHQG